MNTSLSSRSSLTIGAALWSALRCLMDFGNRIQGICTTVSSPHMRQEQHTRKSAWASICATRTVALTLWAVALSARAQDSVRPEYFYLPFNARTTALSGALNTSSDVMGRIRTPLDPNRTEYSYNPLGQVIWSQTGRVVTHYFYNGFGGLSHTTTTIGPPLPRYEINTVDLGDVSISGTLERSIVRGTKYEYHMKGLSVTATGNSGTATSAVASDSAPVVALRVGANGLSLRFSARLADRTFLKARMEDVGLSSDGKLQSLSVGTTRLAGPLASTAFQKSAVTFSGVLNGNAELANEGEPIEFTVEWLSPTKGKVTFAAPANLITATATIRPAAQGRYLVAGRGVTLLIRSDGSGRYDIGYGKVSFDPGTMRTGTLADKTERYRVDDFDPVDDGSAGATTLTIPAGMTSAHSLSAGDKQDWFKADLVNGTWYSFLLSASSDAASLEVFDENLSTIDGEISQGGGFLCKKSGVYYFRASIPDSLEKSLTYTVRSDETSRPISDAIVLSPASSGTSPLSSLAPGGHQWHKIELTAGSLGYAFATMGVSPSELSQVEVNIYDASLSLVNASEHESKVQFVTGNETATYYIDVYNPLSSVQEYAVRWVEAAAPTHVTSFDAGSPSIAVDGATAVTGGDVFSSPKVFVRSGAEWTSQQILSGTGPVAIQGDTLLVGPSVYVRSNGAWTLQTVLPVSNIVAVCLDGDTAVVGTSYSSADIYVRTGTSWAFHQRLIPSDAGFLQGTGSGSTQPTNFGRSVAISGDAIIIGAPNKDLGLGFGLSSYYAYGAAYVFSRSGGTWTEQQKLVAPIRKVRSGFAEAVAIDGDTVIVGSPSWGTDTRDPVSAAYIFVFANGAWTALQTLKAFDSEAYIESRGGFDDSKFGSSVAVHNGATLVGARGAGVAYSFQKWSGVWVEQYILTSGGYKVAVSAEAALVTPGGIVFDYGAISQ